MTTYEWWSVGLGAAALTLNGGVFGLLFWQLTLLGRQVSDSGKSLTLATKEAATEHERQRQQATLDFIGATIEKQHELFGKLKNDPEFMNKSEDRETVEYLIVRDYLSYLEDLSVGVNMGVLDREVVDRSIGGRIIRAWFDVYGEWIKRERRELRSERLYEEVEMLAKSLRNSRNSGN